MISERTNLGYGGELILREFELPLVYVQGTHWHTGTDRRPTNGSCRIHVQANVIRDIYPGAMSITFLIKSLATQKLSDV